MALGNNLKKNETEQAPSVEESVSEATETNVSEPHADENADESSSKQQYCVFKAGNEEYAIQIHLVKEVVKLPPIAPLPQLPKYIIGMSNIRGNVYGVLDLKIFFNKEASEIDQTSYLLVLEHEEYKMAIVIPGVPDTLLVADEMVEQLTATRMKSVTGQKYLKGIIRMDNRMIILFDILGMITGSKFTEVSV